MTKSAEDLVTVCAAHLSTILIEVIIYNSIVARTLLKLIQLKATLTKKVSSEIGTVQMQLPMPLQFCLQSQFLLWHYFEYYSKLFKKNFTPLQ